MNKYILRILSFLILSSLLSPEERAHVRDLADHVGGGVRWPVGLECGVEGRAVGAVDEREVVEVGQHPERASVANLHLVEVDDEQVVAHAEEAQVEEVAESRKGGGRKRSDGGHKSESTGSLFWKSNTFNSSLFWKSNTSNSNLFWKSSAFVSSNSSSISNSSCIGRLVHLFLDELGVVRSPRPSDAVDGPVLEVVAVQLPVLRLVGVVDGRAHVVQRDELDRAKVARHLEGRRKEQEG